MKLKSGDGFRDVVDQFLKPSTDPLSVDEERALAETIWHKHDGWQEARDRMYRANLRLVASVALKLFRYQQINNCEELNDALVEGAIGLLSAIDKFDYQKGRRLSTFATFWIRQGIEGVIDEERFIHLPPYIVDSVRQYKKYRQRFIAQSGREPTVAEWAQLCGIREEELVGFLIKTRDCQNLGVFYGGDDRDGVEWTEILADESVGPEWLVVQNNLCELIADHLGRLEPREAAVLQMRFGLDDGIAKKLDEIGQALGLCRERVRQIEVRALKKMRQMLPPEIADGLGKV